jgi:hypothetical protein
MCSHWPVFWASTAVVLITWGIVPTQAGIFSTEKIIRTFPSDFAVSTDFVPSSEQEDKVTMRYTHRTYAVVMLNETLPPYSTRNYTLAPFKSLDPSSQNDGIWTAPTTLYSLDMQCEEASQNISGRSITYTSKTGCWYQAPGVGNQTIGSWPQGFDTRVPPGYNAVKEFSARYIGYWGQMWADYYLEGFCPETANRTFLASFTRNKKIESDLPSNSTNIFCQPWYYEQYVNATIDVATRRPLGYVALDKKKQLTNEMLNTTLLDSRMNGGANVKVRGDSLPDINLPSYMDQVAGSELSTYDSTKIQPLAALAALIGGPPLEQYLDPKGLRESYEQAYRLLFVSYVVDVLTGDYTKSEGTKGERQLSSEAVVLEPVFTYIVEGLLGVVSLATIALLYLSLTRERNLRSDPNTIASVMSLVADNQLLLTDLQTMDCCTMEEVEKRLSHKRWKLVKDEFQTGYVYLKRDQGKVIEDANNGLQHH